MATATTSPVRLPPGPPLPKVVQGIAFLASRHGAVAAMHKRYGGAFTVNLPIMNRTVVISDPVLAKDLFSSNPDLVGTTRNNLGARAVGPGSLFSLNGKEHLQRRKLLAPPFHGKRMRTYERIFEEEVVREIATWPQGSEFETLRPMLRLTLSAILRAVFGAEGPQLDELRDLLPTAVAHGSYFAVLPPKMRRDFGPWRPWSRYQEMRRRIDAVIYSLIADARADPAFEERSDVLALLLQARYDDGEPIPDQHIAAELMTLLAAGHETTATSLAWAVERLRRHPQLLSRLADEVDAGGSELRRATICEVMRSRPVIDAVPRGTRARIQLGEWVIPEGYTLLVSVPIIHELENGFPDAASFNPDRFVGAMPDPAAWMPFGGGVRRCIGAAFANMEMDVSLRTLLRELHFEPTDAPDERRHTRGVVVGPAKGARAVVYRRRRPSGDAVSASAAHHVSS